MLKIPENSISYNELYRHYKDNYKKHYLEDEVFTGIAHEIIGKSIVLTYYKNGLLHREDGPALIVWSNEYDDIHESYYLYGRSIRSFSRIIKKSKFEVKFK